MLAAALLMALLNQTINRVRSRRVQWNAEMLLHGDDSSRQNEV